MIQDSVDRTATAAFRQSKLRLTSTELTYRPFQRPEQTCPLLCLPPERRLEIYSYLLIESKPVDLTYEFEDDWDSDTGWHALFSTSLQIRNEALPFYHGNNTFICRYFSLEVGGLRPWLARLHAASPVAIRCIKSIAVDLWPDEYMLLDWNTAFCTGKPEKYAAYPQFDLCNDIIACMSLRGLRAHQLVWPGVSPENLRNMVDMDSCPPPVPRSLDVLGPDVVQRFLLNKFVITPLLIHHGLWDADKGPVDVRHQLTNDQELINYINEFESDFDPEANHLLQYVEEHLQAFWQGHAPEDWYCAWKTGNGRLKGKSAKGLKAWLAPRLSHMTMSTRAELD